MVEAASKEEGLGLRVPPEQLTIVVSGSGYDAKSFVTRSSPPMFGSSPSSIIVYLEGQGDVVSRLLTGIIGVITWLIYRGS